MKVLGYLKEHARPIVVVLVATIAVGATKIDSFGAGWVDDWLTSKTTTSGGYFEGQARGYATAGGFSARWPSRNDYLLSVQSPKLKTGCGGIDFFGGSLSFLDPDMLVQKLQNILTNSAFLAFDMALASLCPMCSNLMKSAEDLSNQLNSMAINDCNMAKGLTANLQPAFEGVKGALWENKGSEAINQGVSNSYNKYKNDISAAASSFHMPSMEEIEKWWNTQKGKPATHREQFSGCTGIFANLFPSDDGSYPVSVLDVIGGEMYLPGDHVKLVRGLVGDIVIKRGQKIDYQPPCPGNAGVDISQFSTGDMDAMVIGADGKGACSKAAGANVNLNKYVSDKMRSISNKLATKSNLDPDEISFIQSVPTGVLYGMRAGVGSGQTETLISSLSGITANLWTMAALKSLMARAEAMLNIVGASKDQMELLQSTCNLKDFRVLFENQHKVMLTSVGRVVNGLAENTRSMFSEYSTSLAIAKQLEDINTQIRINVSKNFGASVAARAMRNM